MPTVIPTSRSANKLPAGIKIHECKTQDEIELTYLVMHQLRPHIIREDYFKRIDTLMKEEKYRLLAACAQNEWVSSPKISAPH